jgi:hypothetical protein
MAEQITKIVIRSGTDSQRRTANTTGVIFNIAEPGYCVDTQRLYIGDGSAGGVPVASRNLGRVSTFYGSYLNSGFSQEAYNALASQGAERGDIIYDALTRTIFSLSARSNFTSSVPLTSDFVKYETSTLVNSNQFYYDANLFLNLQDQGVEYPQLNSNVVDGVTLQKISTSSQISIASGGLGTGVANTNLKFIAANSLYLNSSNSVASPNIVTVAPGQIVGRTGSSLLSAININTILNSASYTANPGIIITPTTSTITFGLDPAYIAALSRLFLNKDTTITGNLSVTGGATIDGVISSTGSGILKNQASFASPRINAGTIPLFRATYDMQLVTAPNVAATGGTPTFSPSIVNGSIVPAGTQINLVAGTALTNVLISFGYKFI